MLPPDNKEKESIQYSPIDPPSMPHNDKFGHKFGNIFINVFIRKDPCNHDAKNQGQKV